MNLDFFNIDIYKIYKDLLPPYYSYKGEVKKSDCAALYDCIASSLINVQKALVTKINDIEKFTKINSIHKNLVSVINDIYDNNNRLITITENNKGAIGGLVLYNSNETTDVSFAFFNVGETDPNPKAFYNSNELISGADFTINIPSYIYINTLEFEKWIKQYLYVGVTYNLKNI